VEGGTCVKGKSERRLRWGYMADRLHILTWNRTKKSLTIALSGAGRMLRGRECKGDLNNLQYRHVWNCHNESSLYKEYILIKIYFKKSYTNFNLSNNIQRFLFLHMLSNVFYLFDHSHYKCEVIIVFISTSVMNDVEYFFMYLLANYMFSM
jgi:hypothetical protein